MRMLLEVERPLVIFLFELAALPLPEPIMIQPMEDGGMRSMAFAPLESSRVYGSTAAECQFKDTENIPVLATLYLDQYGAPFEIDVWKVDYSRLVRWPTRQDLTDPVRYR